MTDTTAAPSEGAQRIQQIHAEGQHHTRAGLCQKALQYHTRLQHAGSSYAGRKWYCHRLHASAEKVYIGIAIFSAAGSKGSAFGHHVVYNSGIIFTFCIKTQRSVDKDTTM